MELEPGHLVAGRFRVVRFLGEGAVSAVYEAIDDVRGHRVAVKILHRELSQNAEIVQRFEREAEAASRIGSDHIVHVYGAGATPEGRFIVLEYLDGGTLADLLRKRRPLPSEEAVSLVLQLLAGLSKAHELGIVHRDLKPANLFLVPGPEGRGFLKILDFGASKLTNAGQALTRTGAMVGTPMYMSPEQIRSSDKVDPRSDVYAAGVILYESVTGKVPFDVKNAVELAFRVVSQDPPPPETHLPSLDPELSAIIRRAMSRDPDARFQTAAEMYEALGDWLKKRGIPLPPHTRAAPVAAPAAAPTAAAMALPSVAPARSRTILLYVVGALLLVVAIVLALHAAGV
ncbi:serine/threonine-protein kinase [Polyangium jinanense]|uniref:non-specific serine/threonine protein kinase n=1 Tax=Polyangium jinanense TaxID=2829994 RepID=A0A9X3X271_9BACT|nr:serine/threonine-protein kinase [Polyangium jinanense]MDC3955080.1 serine/threonine protein kinase [Polyangium jinanense]MDC3981150.1 serine/threonine protein kinase [Polyangium jinanense]